MTTIQGTAQSAPSDAGDPRTAKVESVDPSTALVRLAEPVRGRLIAAVAWGALAAVARVVALVAAAEVVRGLLADPPEPSAAWTALAVSLGAVLISLTARAWSFRVSHLAAFDHEVILRRMLVTQLGRLPLGVVQRIGSGALKKVVQDDVRSLHAAIADSTPLLGYAGAGPVAALVALVVVDWRLALAVLAVLPLVAVLMYAATRDYAEQRQAYDRANEAINTAVVEYVQGMQEVRTFDAGTDSFGRFVDRVRAFTMRLEAWTDASRTGTLAVRLLVVPLPVIVVVSAVGGWLALSGRIEVADLVAGLLLCAIPVESVTPLMWLSHFLDESKASAVRIAEVLDLEPLAEPEHPREPCDGTVVLTDVVFSYDAERDRPALDGVSLEVPDGTVCALVGPSGSGKSTVARLIPRFFDIDAGSVAVGGVDVREIAGDRLLRHVALVLQEPFLLHASVRDNLTLARPDATDAEVEDAARAAQAHDFIVGELPEGYDTVVGERGASLSGGQRQRLTIARALLSDARVVVLDEATAFADPENEAAIQRGLAELTRGRTVIVVAHRLSTIVDAHQIVVLDGGRVAEHGTHDELLAAAGRYEALWRRYLQAQRWGLGTGRQARTEVAR